MAAKKTQDEQGMTVQEARDAMRERLAVAEPSAIVSSDAPISDESQEIMDRITAEILSATSLDEILSGGQTTPVEAILDETVEVRSFAVRNGDLGPFAVIEAVRVEDGEVLTVACGGQLVLAALFAFEKNGLLPARCRFAQAGRAYRLLKPVDTRTFEIPADVS